MKFGDIISVKRISRHNERSTREEKNFLFSHATRIITSPALNLYSHITTHIELKTCGDASINLSIPHCHIVLFIAKRLMSTINIIPIEFQSLFRYEE